MEHGDQPGLKTCTFSRTQVKGHLDTNKHKQALVRQAHSLRWQRAAATADPEAGAARLSSPYPDPPPRERPQHDLFCDARSIDDIWLDEQGNELQLPFSMADDQNWSSQRAQDFWHDIDAARTHGEPLEHRWGSLSDDDSSSTASRSEDGERGMPGDFVPGSELTEFMPYPSKTVSSYPPVSREK